MFTKHYNKFILSFLIVKLSNLFMNTIKT